jgi:hypothetical protein
MRDQIVDFVRRWSEKTEIGAGRFIGWLDITASKFYGWRERYGRSACAAEPIVMGKLSHYPTARITSRARSRAQSIN